MEVKIQCKHCGRFLGIATKSMNAQLKCSNSKCKKLETYKVVFLTDYIKGHDHYHCDHCEKPSDIIEVGQKNKAH